MAVSVKDIMELKCFKNIKLEAGAEGLERPVSTVSVADIELIPEYEGYFRYFEESSFVVSSLVYYKDDSSQIINLVKELHKRNMAGLAYKNVVIKELPEEVIRYADENKFPIFSFGKNVYSESIIYEVMDAIDTEDSRLLSEVNISRMLAGTMSKLQLYFLEKNLSLKFRNYVQSAYISSENDIDQSEIYRLLKNFYLNKQLSDKAILCRYGSGLFIIITADKKSDRTFHIILKHILEYLGVSSKKDAVVCIGGIYNPTEDLDLCLRESYYAYMASHAEGKVFASYNEIGSYKYLIPMAESDALKMHMDEMIGPVKDNEEYMETLIDYVRAGGDYSLAASMYGCHHNTIRYRISKIKEMVGMGNVTEQEFFAAAAAAVRTHLLLESRS